LYSDRQQHRRAYSRRQKQIQNQNQNVMFVTGKNKELVWLRTLRPNFSAEIVSLSPQISQQYFSQNHCQSAGVFTVLIPWGVKLMNNP
jgi:hypothetical protein